MIFPYLDILYVTFIMDELSWEPLESYTGLVGSGYFYWTLQEERVGISSDIHKNMGTKDNRWTLSTC